MNIDRHKIRDAFLRHGVRYLFTGESGAILLGFSDATQVANVFPERSPENGRAMATALGELGFELTGEQAAEIERGKDFIQLKNGPFDLDLIFAPDGIERFDDAWRRHIDVEGFPVCHPDDIIASKAAANRQRDREALPRLRALELNPFSRELKLTLKASQRGAAPREELIARLAERSRKAAESGNTEKADRLLFQATDLLDRPCPDCHGNLAIAYEKANKYAEAIAEWRALITGEPSNLVLERVESRITTLIQKASPHAIIEDAHPR